MISKKYVSIHQMKGSVDELLKFSSGVKMVASKLLLHYLLVTFLGLIVIQNLLAQESSYELKIGHPRIILTKYDELALRFTLMEDPLAEKLKNELKSDADELLKCKDIKYNLDHTNSMLSISREYLQRIITLSLAYRIFEDNKYADKAIDQMMFVSSYPNWNPQHFLDVAEMTAALAIGYDWNFYHLDMREKETIRNRIVEFGLNPGLDVYQNPDNKPHVWYKMGGYWNQVCTGGLVLGALAIGEDFPELKDNIVYHSIKNLIPTLNIYQPDGVWYEGPDYWDYANSYLAMTISSLMTALEHDFGLSKRPGLSKTAEFYINSVSPTGELFNFADTESSKRSLSPALIWYSKTYDLDNVVGYYKEILESNVTSSSIGYGHDRDRLFYLALPWFVDWQPKAIPKPKAKKYEGLVDFLFLLGQNNNDNSIYLAAKGGKGTLNYQQLDAGTFVIDSKGERWGIDLGSANFSLPNFSQNEVSGERWKYYRNTNKSHSTLVIGDDIQNPDGEGRIIDFEDQVNQPFGVFDLSPTYKQVKKVHRGFKLLSHNQILIRDEVEFDGTSNAVRWGMMTDASVELQDNKVLLTKNGKKFLLQAYSNQPVKFQVKEAKAYHKEAKDNSGKRLIYVMLNEGRNQETVELSIVMGDNLNGLSEVIINSKLEMW